MPKKSAKPKRPQVRAPETSLSVATDPKKSVADRVTAMAEVSMAICEDDQSFRAVINVLRDPKEPFEVRNAALQALGAAAFRVIEFAPCRSDYIATLRAVAEDPDPTLRRRALGTLAREKDGYAQKKLIEGLKNPDAALVSPEKALQFLSSDPHAEAYAIAREVVKQPPNDEAKAEALRLLAADPKSAPLFEKVLRDKDELRDNRQIAASALYSLNPGKFQKHARAMLIDKSEYEDIQATSLTALAQFGDQEAVGKDEPLLKGIQKIGAKTRSAKYKKSARQFLARHGR